MATYYTSSTALGGGVGSYVDPFTLQEGLNNVASGDELRVLNDGTYSPSSTLTYSLEPTDFVTISGRNSADTAYEHATIDGTFLSGSDMLQMSGTTYNGNRTYWKNLIFTNSTVIVRGSFYGRQNWMINCQFINSQYAWHSNGYQNTFVNCEFANLSANALHVANESVVIGCSFHDISANAMRLCNGAKVYNSVFYDVSGDAIYGSIYTISGCTFFRNSIDACHGAFIVVDNIFSDSGGYGIDGSYISYLYSNNLFYNNTLGDANLTAGGQGTGLNSITGQDPLFTNTTAGSVDLSLHTGSPAIGAGFVGTIPGNNSSIDMVGYSDIGALQSQASTGGTSYTPAASAKFTRLE